MTDQKKQNLIVKIDFTKSSEWTGMLPYYLGPFHILHDIGHGQNPYEQAISITEKTLPALDEDNSLFRIWRCYIRCFQFYSDYRFCNGFEVVLMRYKEVFPMAMTVAEQSSGQDHLLFTIADGKVKSRNGSVDTQYGQLSPQEQRTENDDNIPARAFDNFQFVNYTQIMSMNVDASRQQAEFALAALMAVPSQYKATIELGILGQQKGISPERIPLPPSAHSSCSRPHQLRKFQQEGNSLSKLSNIRDRLTGAGSL
ncbi:hypothetical protein ACJRO7_012621, partial [Eucalyptus globulus]